MIKSNRPSAGALAAQRSQGRGCGRSGGNAAGEGWGWVLDVCRKQAVGAETRSCARWLDTAGASWVPCLTTGTIATGRGILGCVTTFKEEI